MRINLKKLWNKGVTDEWFDLKAPEGGRIHCLLDLKKPVSVEELDQEKDKKKVFQVFHGFTLFAYQRGCDSTRRSRKSFFFDDQTLFATILLRKII